MEAGLRAGSSLRFKACTSLPSDPTKQLLFAWAELSFIRAYSCIEFCNPGTPTPSQTHVTQSTSFFSIAALSHTSFSISNHPRTLHFSYHECCIPHLICALGKDPPFRVLSPDWRSVISSLFSFLCFVFPPVCGGPRFRIRGPPWTSDEW